MAFDPMQMMMLMQGVQGFTDNFSAARRGVQPPQQGGGMQEMVPMMAMMQRGQAANAEMELERQKFAAAQQAAQQRQQMLSQAAKDMQIPESVVSSNPDAVISAWADRLKAQKLGAGDQLYVGGQMQAENPALLQAQSGGAFNPRNGAWAPNQGMREFELTKAATGATRISNPVSITQDTLAAEMAKTPAAMFRKVADASYAAQSGLDATRSIYELAKQNKDLFGPGMQLKADTAKAIEAAKNVVSGGKRQPTPEEARLLAVSKAVEVRQVNSAISKLRDIGGNDTEKEYERVLKAIPGLETSLPTHEAVFIQEKTAADYLTGMQEYVAQKTARATQDRSLGITTVDDAISEYKRMNPLGEQLAKNLQAVMQANGTAAQTPPPGESVDMSDPDAVANFYLKKGK